MSLSPTGCNVRFEPGSALGFRRGQLQGTPGCSLPNRFPKRRKCCHPEFPVDRQKRCCFYTKGGRVTRPQRPSHKKRSMWSSLKSSFPACVSGAKRPKSTPFCEDSPKRDVFLCKQRREAGNARRGRRAVTMKMKLAGSAMHRRRFQPRV